MEWCPFITWLLQNIQINAFITNYRFFNSSVQVNVRLRILQLHVPLQIVIRCSGHQLSRMQCSQSAVRHWVITRCCSCWLGLAGRRGGVEGPWRTGEAGLRGGGSPGSGGMETGGGQHGVERGRQTVAGGSGQQRGGDVRRQPGFSGVDPRRQEERCCSCTRAAVSSEHLLTLTPFGSSVLKPHLHQ